MSRAAENLSALIREVGNGRFSIIQFQITADNDEKPEDIESEYFREHAFHNNVEVVLEEIRQNISRWVDGSDLFSTQAIGPIYCICESNDGFAASMKNPEHAERMLVSTSAADIVRALNGEFRHHWQVGGFIFDGAFFIVGHGKETEVTLFDFEGSEESGLLAISNMPGVFASNVYFVDQDEVWYQSWEGGELSEGQLEDADDEYYIYSSEAVRKLAMTLLSQSGPKP